MIVADASWVIGLSDPTDEHHASAVALVERADGRRLMHAVTLAECLVYPARTGQQREVAERLRTAFEIVMMDDDSPLRWAELRVSETLRLPDAIVLDTALTKGASAIATFDERLRAAARRRGVNVLP